MFVEIEWRAAYESNRYKRAAGVLLGLGDGTFEAAESYGSGGLYPMSIVAADVNGDAAPDLLLGNECDNGRCDAGHICVLLHTPVDTTPPSVTIFAAPNVLWPPNGKMVPVTVSGMIVDTGTGVDVNRLSIASPTNMAPYSRADGSLSLPPARTRSRSPSRRHAWAPIAVIVAIQSSSTQPTLSAIVQGMRLR